MGDERFPRACRMTKRADYQSVFRRRCTAADDRLLVFAGLNGQPFPRLGLSVSRKVGPAVVRNRWKRLIREAFRLERTRLPGGLDLVTIPRGTAEPELDELRRSLVRLAGRVARKLGDICKRVP